MEVVALNTRLRGYFSSLLKQLSPLHDISVLSALKRSVSDNHLPSLTTSNDFYTQHCHFMLWRLNSYQYGSVNEFLLDLDQLERATESKAIQKRVKSLVGRLVVFENEKQSEESLVKVSYQCGTTVSLASSSGIPGIQEVASIGSLDDNSENRTVWLCNVTMYHQILTIGTFETKKEASQGYEEYRKLMAANVTGFNEMVALAAQMKEEQRKEDRQMLTEAVAQCHSRLTMMKVAPVTAPTSAPSVTTMTSMANEVLRFVAKNTAAATTSSLSLKASPVPTKTKVSPQRVLRASKRHRAENTYRAVVLAEKEKEKIGSAGFPNANSLLAGGQSYLKLRRLVQKRLCRHLKGKEVCVLSSPGKHDGRLRASGRLEAGKVYSFRRKKQMTFADYVCDELGRAESACAHTFLIRSKESIDDHLKVCDAFLDLEPTSSHYPPTSRKKRKGIAPNTPTR